MILEESAKYIGWLDEDNIVWIDRNEGLKQVNMQTGAVTTLLENCENRTVSTVATSPLLDGMVYVTISHQSLLDSDSTMYFGKTMIYKLDAFTGEQWLVDLED